MKLQIGDELVPVDDLLLLARTGSAMLVSHLVERLLDTLILLFYKPEKPLTTRDIEELNAKESHDTLGKLIKAFGTYVEIDPEVANELDKYLRRRNDFIHNLTRTLGVDLSSKPGRDRLNELAFHLYGSSIHYMLMFSNMLHLYAEQSGAPPEYKTELDKLFEVCDRVEEVLGPISRYRHPWKK